MAGSGYRDYSRLFQIIPANELPPPHCCVSCGTVSRDCLFFGLRDIIHIPNTDPETDRFGSVLICTVCIQDATDKNPLLGVMSIREHEEILAANTKDVSKLARVDAAILDFATTMDVARTYFADAISADVPDILGIDPELPVENEVVAGKFVKKADKDRKPEWAGFGLPD